MQANIKEVFCSSSMASSSAPACTSMWDIRTCPSVAARCKGVPLLASVSFCTGEYPYLKKKTIISILLKLIALGV